MKIVGLTGGIGSGKTTVAKMFAEQGVPIYIADERAREVMDRSDIVKRVSELFEESVVVEGKLDRKKIRTLVFADKERLEGLNQIVHPEVKADFERFKQQHAEAGFVIKESAILFEQGLDKECDYTILVTAPEQIRIDRVKHRDNVSEYNIRQIINNQWNDMRKKPLSDYIIENIDRDLTKKQVIDIVNDINFKNSSI
ncbi:dephospho-CoA kinase [Myroides pelagicus]|uniref:dephospho-CoA kinase n=1 Tax=Myroides pelagicus TaxID=270914 RepID=UPI002DBB40A1|nr:dephospho-CoA kinase [Myroides pelagicus]MEC4113883.1 dephospho-CoA kinase [Myroides pelagicus]